MTEERVEKTVLFVRIGTYYDNKEKPYHKFRYAEDDELGEDVSFTISKDTKHLRGVGLVYELIEISFPTKPGERRWQLAHARYKDVWHDDKQRLEWDTQQEVRDAEHAAVVKARTAADDRPLREAIAPLRDLYKRQVGGNRSQLLAYIVSEITK